MMLNQIFNEDCAITMGKMQKDSIDLILTSPPYDDMRSYNPLSEEKFQSIAEQFFSVLKPGGALVWIVKDQTVDGSETGTSFRQALAFMDIGFKLFDTMIYETSPRGILGGSIGYWQVSEYMFVFSKGKLGKINMIEDRKNVSIRGVEQTKTRQRDGSFKYGTTGVTAEYGRRTNIWHYYTGNNRTTKDKYAFGHPAMFPEKLAHDHIVSWTDEGDVVYDPFMGAGTTAKMAIKARRQYIGSEIDAEYCKICDRRIKEAADMFSREEHKS